METQRKAITDIELATQISKMAQKSQKYNHYDEHK